jgi:hypothetical protein
MKLALTFFVVIAFFAAASSFLAATGEIINRERKGLKTITARGWILLGINLFIILFSVFQYRQNEIDVNEKEEAANTKQLQRDSVLRILYDSSLYVMKQKYDSSHTKIVLTIANALGKYGYRLDSSNQTLVKLIRDSSKTRVILPNDPVLVLCFPNGIKLIDQENERRHYEVSVCSQDAGSSQFDITCFVVIADTLGNLLYKGKIEEFVPSNVQIPTNLSYVRQLDIQMDRPYSTLYLFIKGKYKNMDGTKSYPVSVIYYYNNNGNTSGMITGKTALSIIECVNRATN